METTKSTAPMINVVIYYFEEDTMIERYKLLDDGTVKLYLSNGSQFTFKGDADHTNLKHTASFEVLLNYPVTEIWESRLSSDPKSHQAAILTETREVELAFGNEDFSSCVTHVECRQNGEVVVPDIEQSYELTNPEDGCRHIFTVNADTVPAEVTLEDFNGVMAYLTGLGAMEDTSERASSFMDGFKPKEADTGLPSIVTKTYRYDDDTVISEWGLSDDKRRLVLALSNKDLIFIQGDGDHKQFMCSVPLDTLLNQPLTSIATVEFRAGKYHHVLITFGTKRAHITFSNGDTQYVKVAKYCNRVLKEHDAIDERLPMCLKADMTPDEEDFQNIWVGTSHDAN